MTDNLVNPALRVSETCTGCGACLVPCQAGALTLTSEKPEGWGRKYIVVDHKKCQLCAACIPACKRQSLHIS